ncbi:MAG: hypothetical protein JWQ11_3883, partial [Rhizobacter sp.]|nr:hypothetical protein [Rhizobacter sp.]
MKLFDSSSDAVAAKAFLDLLTDAVVVIDLRARVRFANTAALRIVSGDAGTPVSQFEPSLGADSVRWIERCLQGQSRFGGTAKASPAPLEHVTRLADGRDAALVLAPLDSQFWALRIEPQNTAPQVREAPLPAGTADGVDELIKLLWDWPFPASLQDDQFRIVEVNRAYTEFTGYTREQMIGRDPLELQPQVDLDDVAATRALWRERSGEVEPTQLAERRIIDSGGRMRWYRVARRALLDGQKRRFHLAMLQDVTAEHVAREQADRSLRELDQWFDLSPVGMVLFDDAGLLVRTNPAFEALAGQVPVLLSQASASVQRLLGWADDAPLPQLQPGPGLFEGQGWVTQQDGVPRRLRAIVRCYQTPGGQRRYMGIVEDRSMEEERDLAQMQIGALMDTAGGGVATFQEASGWVRGKESGSPSSAPASAALQAIGRDVVLPESLIEFEKVQHALRQGERVEARYAIRHPELGVRWLLTRVEPGTLASGKRTMSVVTLDVTDQQQAKQRSEQLLWELTTILESSTAGIAYLRGNVLVRCNRRFERLLGLASGTSAGMTFTELFAHQPDARRIAGDTQQALLEGGIYETEFQLDSPNPAAQWCALSVRRAGPPSQAMEAIAVMSDITRLKSQQAELEELARDRELMFSVSEVGIAFLRHGRLQRANEALGLLVGCRPEELQNIDQQALFFMGADFARHNSQEETALQRVGRWSGERQMLRRDGTVVWVQVSKRLVVEGDPSGGVIASYVNVDDRHRAELAVTLQAENTRAILDSVLVGIVTVGSHGIEWMNRSARRMFGGSLEDFAGQPISTVATPEPDHPFRRTQYLQELAEGLAETFECRVRGRDGREFWVVGNAVVTGLEAPGERQLTYALLDIEQRRQAEARIAEAQASLQRIIEMAPLAITLSDARTLKVLQSNQMAAALTGRTV